MKVFISYRRSDTQDLAGRIADWLRTTPGVTGVFLDVSAIEPGADFTERIAAALAEAPVCIVLIGPAWRGPPDTARIFDPADFVRREVSIMLARGLRIIPVLASDAVMPAAEALPEDLRALTRLNALRIRHDSFDRDLAVLVGAILGDAGRALSVGRRSPPFRTILRAAVSFLASGAGIILGAAIHSALTGRSLDEALGGSGQVWLLIVVVLTAGTLAGTLTGRPSRQIALWRDAPPHRSR
jgi:hypothetical protein